jgi:type IV secretory pathway TrbL component
MIHLAKYIKKSKTTVFIKKLLEEVDTNLLNIEITTTTVEVSVHYGNGNMLSDLIKFLSFIEKSSFIKNNYSCMTEIGYYDSVDDIKMTFSIDADELKKIMNK